MNKQSILYLNSKDFSNGPNNYTGNYILPIGVQDCTHYYIKNFVCPYTQYTTIYKLQSGATPYFTINQNAGPLYEISIPVGNYSAQQLINIIQPQLDGYFGAGIITLTYSPNTYLFTFENSGPPSFELDFSQTGSNFTSVYQSIGWVLGFPNFKSTLGSEFTSSQSAQLAGPLNYFLLSSALCIGDSVSFFQNQQSTCILQIPINTFPSGYIIYQNPFSDFIPLRKKQLQNIDLQLVDDYGNLVNLTNLNFSLTIVVSNRNNI